MAETVPCRSCGAPMIWAKMASGKSNPLDAEPHVEGTIRLHQDGTAEVLKKAQIEAMAPSLEPQLYRSHFATCPNSAQHRRKTNA